MKVHQKTGEIRLLRMGKFSTNEYRLPLDNFIFYKNLFFSYYSVTQVKTENDGSKKVIII